MRIALISCTSSKKTYKCPARELYSESPRFRLAYDFAKLVSDKIFILSAKYGLVPEDRVIEPYNETLKEKSAQERRNWGDTVLNELRKVSDIEHDEFIVLAGKVYNEKLLPHLSKFWIPLKGKALGKWIPELERLIHLEKETDKVDVLHMLFNGLPRLDWMMIDEIPYQNGIYIMFEKGESYRGMDRIVHIGTHRSQGRLRKRLKDHFEKEDADGSIFRKNIGRAFLNMNSDPYLRVWEIDMHHSKNVRNYGHLVNARLETELEAKISQYLRNNITFVCFPVDEEAERLRLKKGIIATLNKHQMFGPSNNWLGLNSPVLDIANSGLWNRQGLKGQLLSDEELERVKWLARFGNDGYRNNKGHRTQVKRAVKHIRTVGEIPDSGRKTADDVRQYIEKLLQEAKMRGEDYIDLVSGNIHKQLGMKNRMPQVCIIMYEKMMPGDEVLHTIPSGKSSTIKIRYDLKNR
ncbi:DUF6884 domain-containing protein [Crassaminicella indica]|uniref:GIY-YIG domain-containing protein n=1 Tax=Crassaminicella indica TaxID=2855394 RepID=A0ABX8R8V4_9CLOT|nr:DUF6884 domain-containing protein [Crassaminicella indica]QXM05457.1 hypothetical protein KVH43_08680 [Crassaminicella indica]